MAVGTPLTNVYRAQLYAFFGWPRWQSDIDPTLRNAIQRVELVDDDGATLDLIRSYLDMITAALGGSHQAALNAEAANIQALNVDPARGSLFMKLHCNQIVAILEGLVGCERKKNVFLV